MNNVDIGLDYDLHADDAPRQVHGTYQVVVNVSSANGWSHSIPLTPTPRVLRRTTSTRTRRSVSTRSVRSRRASRAETGLVTTAGDDLRRAARARTRRASPARRSRVTSTSKLDFQLSPIEMTPASTADARGAEAASAGSVTIATVRRGDADAVEAQRVRGSGAGRAARRVRTRRWPPRPRCWRSTGDGSRSVRSTRSTVGTAGSSSPSTSIPPAGDRTMVRVESMRALARLAHRQRAADRARRRRPAGTDSRSPPTRSSTSTTPPRSRARPAVIATRRRPRPDFSGFRPIGRSRQG